jgi:transposase
LTALRQSGALAELAERGVPEVWRDSLTTLLSVIDDIDRQLAPLERELRPLAREDERARLLMTIPASLSCSASRSPPRLATSPASQPPASSSATPA